ncbi:GerMN domain-containing protein [Paenibacillus woosongensis]|uniref:GerMN domain-containing protein n=1 Tax=Paenibacillus woosongensis TaxID=307580 RepID=A0AA95I3L8_9BACL|nr:GerMN domain-containing protein [Paenibacillus woosongensis]WHX47302.1 GerMN domain-containing protein [Paenibacillus woosongensis]
MNRKLWIIGVLVLLLAVTAGCGQKPNALVEGEQVNQENQGNAGNSVDGTAIQEPPSNPVAHGAGDSHHSSPEEQANTMVIQAYFTDDQLNELFPESKEITYSADAEKYMQTLKALQQSETPGLLPLWEKVNFKQAVFEGGKLTVDLTLPDEARLGAGGEALAVESLTKALFQFEEVQSIEILVDGQQADTLMGHVELEHPILRK